MTRRDLIDETGPIPKIAGRRINLLDFLVALESPKPATQFYEGWELSEDQVEASLEYIKENKDYLQQAIEEQSPSFN